MPFIWFWPDGYNSCIILTHDVETLAGRDYCNQLIGVNAQYGFRSSFQVVPEKRYEVSHAFLKEIVDRGCEVNVHDLNHDGCLFANRNEFFRRAVRINEYGQKFNAKGFRAAALYRNPDWFYALDFEYDMSIPNVAHLDPQRGGCCTVLPFFIDNLVELPVTCTQDYSLFHILGEYSIDLWRRQIELIRGYNGLINILVHPDYILGAREHAVYCKLLEYLAMVRDDGGMWTPLPKEVASWWKQRAHMDLCLENGTWRIVGEGHERARVAFAYAEGDDVRYELT